MGHSEDNLEAHMGGDILVKLLMNNDVPLIKE